MALDDLIVSLRQAGPAWDLMLVAAMLVIGALAGEAIARTTRLPRVVGYTLAGSAAAMLGAGATLPLQGLPALVVDLALALLLFEIGTRVRLRWLRRNPGLFATSVAESLLGALAVYLALRAIGMDTLPAAACAVLAMPASAAVAGRVALELGADGQVTQRMTTLAALSTLFAVCALVLLKAAVVASPVPSWPQAALALAVSTAGALVIAALLAGAVALAARRLDLRNESSILLVLGLVMLAVTAARLVGASTLLVPLLAGLALANTSERPWVWARHFGTAGGLLVLLLFVVVGSSWSPQVLAAGGLAALVLLVARSLGKGAAVLALSPWARSSGRQGLALAIALTPLSATALVMLTELMRLQPALGAQVAPVVLSAIAMLELLGPVAVQVALRLAGELAPVPRETREGHNA